MMNVGYIFKYRITSNTQRSLLINIPPVYKEFSTLFCQLFVHLTPFMFFRWSFIGRRSILQTKIRFVT